MKLQELKEIATKIKLMRQTVEELSRLGLGFPAINRNVARISACVKMLEINISDLVELDS